MTCGGRLPEVVKIEPLVRCLHAVVLQPPGILLQVFRKARQAVATWQIDALREVLQMNSVRVAIAALFTQAETQIDRAIEQTGQDERALRKRCRFAEEFNLADASTVARGWWCTVADDHHQFATVDLILEHDCCLRPKARHLDQVDTKVGVSLPEQLVETLGVVGIDNGIDRRLPLIDGQRPNHFQVAKVGADQHRTAPGSDHPEQLWPVREVHLMAAQVPEPVKPLFEFLLKKLRERVAKLEAK